MTISGRNALPMHDAPIIARNAQYGKWFKTKDRIPRKKRVQTEHVIATYIQKCFNDNKIPQLTKDEIKRLPSNLAITIVALHNVKKRITKDKRIKK